jgi:hypothetical protein
MTKVAPAYLHECLLYRPDTGELFWRVRPKEHFTTERVWKLWNSSHSGKPIRATPDTRGYRIVRLRIGGKIVQWRVHRVIFAMQTGAWPPADVDHKNRVRGDNRWTNLRPATRAENVQNTLQVHNASGLPGVWWCNKHRKWWARLQADGKRQHLGSFLTAEEAHASYLAAKTQLHSFSFEASGG